MTARYIKIAEKLRERIIKGLIPLDAQLSERKLAEQFSTGRSTIAAALKILKEDGHVETVARSVTKVISSSSSSDSVWEKLIKRGISVNSSNDNISAIRYLSNSGKIGLTFGLHEDFKPYEPLKKAMRSLPNLPKLTEHLNTFDDKGLPLIRETLVQHLKSYDIHTSADNIIIFPGYLEAIYTIATSLLNHGVNLYCMQGDMIWGQKTINTTGANMYKIPLDNEGPDALQFKENLKYGQNILYVNPVNSFPSGLTFTDNRMDELTKICCKHNIPIIENDFLRDIWVKPPPKPLKARDDDNVIYIGTMANCYVTGIRLGWAVVPEVVVPRICEVKMQMTSGNNMAAELIVNEILSQGYYYEFLENLRKLLPERIEKVDKILTKYLKDFAKWNIENIAYTAFLELDERVNIEQVILENPYFLLPDKLVKGKPNCIFTNILGMSIEDFEGMASHCHDTIVKQLKQ